MKKSWIFAGVILAVALGLALVLYPNRAAGAHALVSVADGDSFTLSLQKDETYHYTTQTGARLAFTLEVQDGKIRFVDSACPDHVCEGFGWLSREGDEAICLPAGVVVSVEGA